MVVYITGIYALILSICQFNEVKMVDIAEVDSTRFSQTPLNDVSEDEISPSLHRFQQLAKFRVTTGSGSGEKKDASLGKTEREALGFNNIFKGSRKNSDEDKKFRINIKESLENDAQNKLQDGDTRNKDEKRPSCPIGLWCVSARKRGYENSATLEQCPPGLWCKRSRIETVKDLIAKQANKRKEEKRCQSDLQCSAKRGDSDTTSVVLNECPPGLWCKRDQTKSDDDAREKNTDKIICPMGFKCSSMNEVGFETSRTLHQCPPGLWCKRDAILVKEEITEPERMPKADCPPGLWCKRNVARIRPVSSESEQGDRSTWQKV